MQPYNKNIRILFKSIQKNNLNLLDLRLKILPQVKIFMILDRVDELRQALDISLQEILHNKQDTVNEKNNKQELKKIAVASKSLFKLLGTLEKKVIQDFILVEKEVRYKGFSPYLKAKKNYLCSIADNIESDLDMIQPSELGGWSNQALKAITDEFEILKIKIEHLQNFQDENFSFYIKSLDEIFNIIEKNEELSALKTKIYLALKEISYNQIKASDLFSDDHYISQLGSKGWNVHDPLRNYIKNTKYDPQFYFNNKYYLQSYQEVRQLRFNPFEHFIRYGACNHYNPSPDFNTLFYLKNNEDVLDANINPLKHFLRLGKNMGCAPCAHASHFFNGHHLNQSEIKIAFAGKPINEERKILSSLHAMRNKNLIREILEIEFDTLKNFNVEYDTIIIGTSGSSELRGHVLHKIIQSGCSIIYIGKDPDKDLKRFLRKNRMPMKRFCAMTYDQEKFIRWQEKNNPLQLFFYPVNDSKASSKILESLLNKISIGEDFAGRQEVPLDINKNKHNEPYISVIGIINDNSRKIFSLLDSLNHQDIARPYEVILINENPLTNTVDLTEKWLYEQKQNSTLNKFMAVRILNKDNAISGEQSLDEGILAATSDIVLVVGEKTVLSTTALTSHTRAYRYGDCDAAIGATLYEYAYHGKPANITECEIYKKKLKNTILPGIQLEDNSIFRSELYNFSFKKYQIENILPDQNHKKNAQKSKHFKIKPFDILASLYFSGKHIRWIQNSNALYLTKNDPFLNNENSLSEIKEWNRLLKKFPDLPLVNRQYYQWKTNCLLDNDAKDQKTLESQKTRLRFSASSRAHISINTTSRPLNILTYKWHGSHQYELFKQNHQFTLVVNNGTRFCNTWDYHMRPIPRNIRFVPLEDIDPREYDFAILPFDEHVLYPKYCKALPSDWGQAFMTMLELTKDIPRAAICHGTPQIFETDDPASGHAEGEIRIGSLEATRALLEDIHVVCNSRQAQQTWKFAKSSYIWHGFSPQEFPEGSHHKDCLTLSRMAFAPRPSYRGEDIRQQVVDLLGDKCTVEFTAMPKLHRGYQENTQEWAIAKFQAYASYIGSFAMYLNPTKHSPMPRSRDEAMLTGTIPISLRNHDVDMFIKNGYNGFHAETAEELAEDILWLKNHEKQRNEISRNARLTAMDIFNIDRYISEWANLMHRLM